MKPINKLSSIFTIKKIYKIFDSVNKIFISEKMGIDSIGLNYYSLLSFLLHTKGGFRPPLFVNR